MAMQKGKSVLAGKFGNRLVTAHQQLKDKPVEHDTGSDLPAGITNGVARLFECKIGTFEKGPNAGEPFYYAAGVVILPKDHAGVRVEGRHTRIGPEPLCDTPSAKGQRKTLEQHLEYFYNELKLLGFDVSQVSGRTPEEAEAGILAGMAALKQAAPTFRFRTWKGKKQVVDQGPDGRYYLFDEDDNGNRSQVKGKVYTSKEAALVANPYAGNDPRVQHVWDGFFDYAEKDSPDGDMGGTVDQSGEAPSVTASANGEQQEQFSEFNDLESLATSATAGNEKAMEQLIAMAKAAGHTEQEIKDAPDWTAVAALCTPPADTDAPAEEAQQVTGNQPQEAPLINSIYHYFPYDPRSKRPAKKPVEVSVVAVDAATQTATIKRLDTKATLKGVPWTSLTQIG